MSESKTSDDDDNAEEHSLEQSEKSTQSNINVSKEPEKSSSKLVLISVVVVIVAVILFIIWPTSRANEQKPLDLSDQIDCSKFFDLKAKYPQQNARIFKSLKVSIEGVYNRNAKPPVITFFSTDQKILDDLMNDVVYLTHKCIKQSYDPINLTYEDLNIEKFLNDNSKIIGEYKNELEKRTILVINNLDELSSKVVPSLHSFTDTYNPLVQKSIIYISIRVPQKPVNPADYIFTHLQNKWNDLASNIKNPLITRVSDQAFFLEPSY